MTETRLPKGLSGSNFPSSGAGWRGWRRRGGKGLEKSRVTLHATLSATLKIQGIVFGALQPMLNLLAP